MTVDFWTDLQSLCLMPPAEAAAALNARWPDDPPWSTKEVLALTTKALRKLRSIAAKTYPHAFDLMWEELQPEARMPDLQTRINSMGWREGDGSEELSTTEELT